MSHIMYLQRMLVFTLLKTISCSLFFHILNTQTMHQLYTFQRLGVHRHYINFHHWSHLHKSFGLCNFSMQFHNSKGSPNKWMKLPWLTHTRLIPHHRDKKIRLFVKKLVNNFLDFFATNGQKIPFSILTIKKEKRKKKPTLLIQITMVGLSTFWLPSLVNPSPLPLLNILNVYNSR
jgi:hypothetical protein